MLKNMKCLNPNSQLDCLTLKISMQNIIKVISIIALVSTSSFSICAQSTNSDTIKNRIKIPDEIISRIPDSEISQFLIARQRAIDKKGKIPLNAFEEIGVSKEIISRVPSGDLFEFLTERGYVELLEHEHIGTENNHNTPSPKEMIKILYTIIFIFGSLIFTSMILAHFNRKKDQEIIVKALENNKDIPVELINSNHQRRYLKYFVLLTALSIGILILGSLDILPGILAVVPLSIAIGYFIIRHLNKSSS